MGFGAISFVCKRASRLLTAYQEDLLSRWLAAAVQSSRSCSPIRMPSVLWTKADHIVVGRLCGKLLGLPHIAGAGGRYGFRRQSTEATWRGIGTLLNHFKPEECANYLVHAGYASA